jgi:hypothetical protein
LITREEWLEDTQQRDFPVISGKPYLIQVKDVDMKCKMTHFFECLASLRSFGGTDKMGGVSVIAHRCIFRRDIPRVMSSSRETSIAGI